MNQISDEFLKIAEQLDSIRAEFNSYTVKGPLQKLEEAATKIGKAWSGSSLGYHSRVYYRDFQSPPPGAHFSQEWGMMQYFTDGTTGEWREYDYDEVQRKIYELAGQPDLATARSLAEQARNMISDKRVELASLISTAQNKGDDAFLSKLRTDIDEITIPTASNIVKGYSPADNLLLATLWQLVKGFSHRLI